MPEEIVQEEINRIYDRDENGNRVKNQLDWQNIITSATIEFYVVHLQVTHRTNKVLVRIAPVLRIRPFFVSVMSVLSVSVTWL